jgi:hypothetical protein
LRAARPSPISTRDVALASNEAVRSTVESGHVAFFAARKRQPNMTDFRSDFQLCCGAKTAGSFAFPLSAIIFANARRDVGTTACVRRCDHGADDN